MRTSEASLIAARALAEEGPTTAVQSILKIEYPTMSFWVSLCGQLAPILAIVVFCAPIPTLLEIRRTQSVGDLPLLPYSSMISSAFVWLTYGLLLNESKIYVANGTGLVLGTIYFLIFIKYAPKKSPTLPGSVLLHTQGILFMIALCGGLYYWTGGPQMVGNLGVALCVIMFGSPLAALRVVFQTKSADAIPLPFTLASIANCFAWTIVGLFEMEDYAIYVPNMLGLSFGLIQVALKVVYGSNRFDASTTLPM